MRDDIRLRGYGFRVWGRSERCSILDENASGANNTLTETN